MNNKEFKKALQEFQSKFNHLQNTVVIMENDGNIHAAMQGDIVGTIRALIDAAHSDHIQFSILLTVGEMLRKDLSEDAIKELTKLHLKHDLQKNIN